MKKIISNALIICLLFSVFSIGALQGKKADAWTVTTNRDGKIFKKSGRTLYFRRETGSSPQTYGKWQKAKITSSTKYYKATGQGESGLIIKKSSKSKALKHYKNHRSWNYNYFKVKNGKLKAWIYGVENMVG